jgi:hypothetical protein
MTSGRSELSLGRRIFLDWRSAVCVLLISCGISFGLGDLLGLTGFGLGVGGSIFNLFATWGIIRLGAGASPKGKRQWLRGAAAVLGFLIKLPIFVALGLWAMRMGGPALPHFLGGIGLVYSALVGWVLAKS